MGSSELSTSIEPMYAACICSVLIAASASSFLPSSTSAATPPPPNEAMERSKASASALSPRAARMRARVRGESLKELFGARASATASSIRPRPSSASALAIHTSGDSDFNSSARSTATIASEYRPKYARRAARFEAMVPDKGSSSAASRSEAVASSIRPSVS
ncbi:MAG: hypothetical protein B9S34_02550 [Opitutia bacterium Tous-C1TDCM]|nr:MAG: hypothetical protein B9S34_02550 [Opitutae bacterium Tous-C1TDCM]